MEVKIERIKTLEEVGQGMGREKSLREVNKFYWPISKDEEFSEEKSLIDSRQQFKFPSLCRLEANSEMFYDKFVC